MILHSARPYFRHTSAALVAAAAFTLASVTLTAQTQDVDRAQLFRDQTSLQNNQPSTTAPGVSSDLGSSPNDPDLGEQQILKRSERALPFTASISVPFYYTSNVALVRSGEESDVLFAPMASVDYAPRLSKSFIADFSVTQQYFRYDRFSELDFGAFDFRAALTYLVPNAHDLTIRVGYDYNRLTQDAGFDEFYSDHTLFLNTNLPIRIGRAQQVSLGTDINISLAGDPDNPRREDFDGYLGYSASLTRALTVDAVGRLALRDYILGDRIDVSESIAVSANYRVTKWLSATAVSTFVWNQSNHSVFDYQVTNVGGAVSFSYKF